MNFGKVSGKGIRVGLSQRTFEPLLHELSGHPGWFVLLRDSGGEDKSHSLLVPRFWEQGQGWVNTWHLPGWLGNSHLFLGIPTNSVVMSGIVHGCICGKKIAENCLPCVLSSGEPLMAST